MKRTLIIFSIALILGLGCKAQQVITNSLELDNNLDRLLKFKGIFEPVDSFLNINFESINSKLKTSKKQELIEQLIVGTWSGSYQIRINGKDKQSIDSSKFDFTKDFYFKEITKGDTLKGEYFIEADSSNNLVLFYDEPQYPYPKEMLDNMTKEELEQISYQVRLLNIFEIEERRLLFFNVIPIMDFTNPGSITHSRLILEQYIKE
jgi:hypothetical protein